jgi:cell division protein FtsL
MIRVINFFCFAVSAFACLALYHVSEQTRVTRAEIRSVHTQIAQEAQLMDVLQAEWGRVADPARIQKFAEAQLGAEDKAAVELSSLMLLPRRGEANTVGDAEVRSASAVVPSAAPEAPVHLVSAYTHN